MILLAHALEQRSTKITTRSLLLAAPILLAATAVLVLLLAPSSRQALDRVR